ncbi:MAG: 16S rRNA (cytidine(1402)-2'-O)-methyltransferase [Alistipes senegalensis]|nr:16S rRNA (cytidine(1402)-2'-O)-methyltransferase [Oxalobacter formigenes]MCM1281608.1 16S rRNA (cytidine(1402)-2'-O)-methyltransferase [Alistipes senegalensis]
MKAENHPAALEPVIQGVIRQNYPPGALYVIATPIGNAGDISLRAWHILSLADAVACEDTRVTGRLLAQYGLAKPLIAAHQHNERSAAEHLATRLEKGERIALVTDAGTPAISDPGHLLVETVRAAGFRVIPIPGASAGIAALSASGLPAGSFYFAGFLPPKNTARENLLRTWQHLPDTLVIHEAPHRIAATLASLCQVFGPKRKIVIARELTKLFEQIHACTLAEAQEWIKADPNRSKGEFILLVAGAATGESNPEETEARRILSVLAEELPLSQAAALAAKLTGMKKNRLYDMALEITGSNNAPHQKPRPIA